MDQQILDQLIIISGKIDALPVTSDLSAIISLMVGAFAGMAFVLGAKWRY